MDTKKSKLTAIRIWLSIVKNRSELKWKVKRIFSYIIGLTKKSYQLITLLRTMQRVDSSKEGLDCVWPKNDEVYEISFKFVKQINLGA